VAENSFDLIVVGGGPGGYVAAIRAAQLGMKTALVERDQLGGICLNWGCIPTKALLRASEIHHLLHHLDQFGFSAKDVSYDPKKVIARSRAVAKQLSNGVAHLMRKNKVTVFDGEAKLAGKGKLSVAKDGKDGADLAAPHIVLATGARARALPGLEPAVEHDELACIAAQPERVQQCHEPREEGGGRDRVVRWVGGHRAAAYG
jgi:dihydrolipoamide dehydrogenase